VNVIDHATPAFADTAFHAALKGKEYVCVAQAQQLQRADRIRAHILGSGTKGGGITGIDTIPGRGEKCRHFRIVGEIGLAKVNPTASGFPEACFGVSERIRIFLTPQGRKDSPQLAVGSFNGAT
jgi:hypothetical protein